MTVLSSIFKNTQTLSFKMIFCSFRRVIWLLTPCLNCKVFFRFIFAFLFSCIWICERDVHFILYTSTTVSPSVVGCCFRSAILDFQKFEILTVYLMYRANVHASPCQILSKSVKRLRRYGDLTVFIMAAVRHFGFWKFKFCNGQDG